MFALVNEGQWLLHAADARRIAEQMTDPSAKRTLLLVAQAYEKMADHAGYLGNEWLCAGAAEFPPA